VDAYVRLAATVWRSFGDRSIETTGDRLVVSLHRHGQENQPQDAGDHHPDQPLLLVLENLVLVDPCIKLRILAPWVVLGRSGSPRIPIKMA